MANNSFLRSITSRDLNQRYANTYLLYKGRPIYCQAINEHPDGGHVINYIPMGNNELSRQHALSEEADVREISVDRPHAGFYTTNSGLAFYFSYRPRKIYSRGLLPFTGVVRDGNCEFRYVGLDQREVGQGIIMAAIKSVLLNTVVSHRTINLDDLLRSVIQNKNAVIMRHHFCFAPDLKDPNNSVMLYRTKRFGTINNETKKITVLAKAFIPELLEMVRGLDKKDLIL